MISLILRTRVFLLSGVAIMALANGNVLFAETVVANAPTTSTDTAPAAGMEEIVVTARRKEESAERVPVSLQAFSPQTLERQVIVTTTDLQRVTPGVVFSGAGDGTLNTTFAIRGQGRDVIGPIAPSVMSYINDVPLPNWGAVMPTFDVANVQILKGPQGTLFGRNTTGGAVLVNSNAPTYDFGGYLSALYGSYAWSQFEGAVNLPIIDDHVALRIAAQNNSRDGYTKSAQGFQAADDLNNNSERVSLLIQPIDELKNVTVVDHYRVKEIGGALHMIGYPAIAGPGGANAVFRAFGPIFQCKTSPSCDYDLALAQDLANPRRYWSSINGGPYTYATIDGVENTTSLNLNSVTVKNIFGYRRDRIAIYSDGGGTEMVGVNTKVHRSDDQLTDELQVSGSLFEDKTQWLAGLFYLNNKPDGPNALANDILRPAPVPQDSWFINSLGEDTVWENSKAMFVSVAQQLIDRLKLNASARYTWDKSITCSQVNPVFSAVPSANFSACEALPGASVGTATFQKLTWSVGLDYQAMDDLFLYAVSRRGYRAGGLNTPNLGGIFKPYQAFGPQTVTDGEVGVKTDWSAGSVRGRVDLSVFIAKFDNLQRQVVGLPANADGDNNPADDPSNTSFVINGGSAHTSGLELNGFVAPISGLRINYGASYFSGKIAPSTPAALLQFVGDDTRFDNAPPHSYTAGIVYTLPQRIFGGELNFNADYYWLDKYKVQLIDFPSHSNTNLGVGLEDIEGKKVDVQFFVHNLTNQLVWENTLLSGASPGPLTVTYGPPRMFGVRVRYNFGHQ